MNKLYTLYFALLLPIMAMAQPKDNSPYSRFGIGDINDRNFYASQFMGGMGASFTDPYQINIVNPAALGHLTAATFDMGLYGELSGIRDGVSDANPTPGAYNNLWSGNLNHLSLALPLQNRVNDLLERKNRDYSVATGFSLLPYSTVGYNIATVQDVDNIGEVKRNFEGVGGTYQFLWSNAVKYKNIAFGANVGYLFGKLEYAKVLEFEATQPFFNTLVSETNRVRGFLWDFGAIYTLNLDNNDKESGNSGPGRKLNFGLHGHSRTRFSVNSESFEGSIQNGTGVIDTLQFTNDISSTGHLPAELGLGVSYYVGQKWSLGVNYSTAQWSQFEAPFVNDNLNNTYRVSFGGFYRPDYKSISNYFSRIYYRFGLFYNQLPNAVPDNDSGSIEDLGISFGMGLPFFYQRKVSHANLGIIFGMRGRGSAIEERYFRISFSFTFNDDEWFIKRKYN